MTQKRENQFLRFAAGVLIWLFVGFMLTNTVFVHTHTLADGSLVSHSHPYNPSGSHTHSANDFSLIEAMNSSVASFLGSLPISMAYIAVVIAIVRGIAIFCCKPKDRVVLSLRAPPVP